MPFRKNPRIANCLPSRDVSFENHTLQQVSSKDEVDNANETLTQRLWTNSLPLAQSALKTKFVQGMKTGTLNPESFGKYNIQDAKYLHILTEALKNMFDRSTTEDIKKFAEMKVKVYTEYTIRLFKEWHLDDPSAISMGEPLAKYTAYLLDVSKTMDPIYMIIATLPCLKLWLWLGAQLHPPGSEMGVYKEFIENNFMTGEEEVRTVEDFINERSGIVDEKKAVTVFNTCMQGEVDFFASVTN